MKKFLAMLLALTMALSLAACGEKKEEAPAETPAETPAEESTVSDVKIGLICVHDINSGYDAAHIEGLTAACEELGIDVDTQVVFKYNLPEDETCQDTAVDLAEQGGAFRDYKTALQEIVQKNRQETLCYRLSGESGPDHDKRFTVQVLLNRNIFAEGTGRSKKEAEQMAAKAALELMGKE